MYAFAENNDSVPNCRSPNILVATYFIALFAYLASSAIRGTVISLDLLTITAMWFLLQELDRAKHEIPEADND